MDGKRAENGDGVSRGRWFSPGVLVAAAFVGPGTVTTCTLAGARFHTTLLWAVVFAIATVLVLQLLSLRVALVGGVPLSEALRSMLPGRFRWAAAALVLSAIGIGNAAYQAGNLVAVEGIARNITINVIWPTPQTATIEKRLGFCVS